jgi:hypothetical protein
MSSRPVVACGREPVRCGAMRELVLWPPTDRIEDLAHRSGEPLSIAAMCDDGAPAPASRCTSCRPNPLVAPVTRTVRSWIDRITASSASVATPEYPPRRGGDTRVRTENENLRGDRWIPLQSYVQLLIAT